jgi:Tfp pilus assembly protein PilE
MNCPKCGTVLSDGAPFCSTCGANLTGPATPGPTPAGMPPMPAMATRTSGLAIAGFVCAFLCSVLGLVLSILGLNECNRSGGTVKGKGFAIAGIIISGLSVVLGILAAVAIPAFLDYSKKSKKSEASLQLNKIMKNAKVTYIERNEFPKGKTALTPAEPCCSQPNNKCAVTPAWATDPVWSALDFQIDEPNLYQYGYSSDGNTVDAVAVGDLDCDGVFVTYHLHMESVNGNPSGTITEPPPNAD